MATGRGIPAAPPLPDAALGFLALRSGAHGAGARPLFPPVVLQETPGSDDEKPNSGDELERKVLKPTAAIRSERDRDRGAEHQSGSRRDKDPQRPILSLGRVKHGRDLRFVA